MKAFTNRNRIFWLAGMAVLVLGFIAAAVILPRLTTPGASGPDARVPGMQNVPPPGTKVHVELVDGG